MLKKISHLKGLFVLIALSIFISCNQNPHEKINILKIRINADANSLNPLKARGETSSYICMQVFQTLISFDYQTNQAVGVLAKNLPSVKKTDSTTLFTYQLRKGIAFDAEHPIFVEDILFSFKLAICPGIVSKGSAAYYSFIDSVYSPSENELVIQTHGDYFLNKYFTGDFFILPKHIYDPNSMLDQFSISELKKDRILELSNELQEYTAFFNDDKFEKDLAFIHGSGPYEIEAWESNQRIILKRKQNWWGAKLGEESTLFQQGTERIQYEIISDDNTALAAFKSGKVDLLKTLNPKDFTKIKSEISYPNAQETKSGYDYLGFNLNDSLLADQSLRLAIAHLINKEEFIQNVYYGNAKETNSPISSYQTGYVLDNIPKINFDPETTIKILKELNWIDSDHNGIHDKFINGKLKELSFNYLFNTNDEKRKSFGIILQNRAKLVGIDIQLVGVEWSTYLEKTRSGDFDMFYGSKGMAPIPPDFYSTFHSNSTNGGRNYCSYQSAIADSLIENIRTTDSDELRIQYYHALQSQLNKDLPMVFLVEPMETFVYSKALKPLLTSPIRPNYWAPSIQFKN